MSNAKTQRKIDVALKEELSNVALSTEGTIPEWLSGTLIRNGPVDVTIDGKQNMHWFDGLAMLHAFSFQQGNVFYTNQFLRTEAYHTVFTERSLNYPGFAVDPCRSLFKRFFTLFFPQTYHVPNANINVAKLADQYVAFTETPLPVKFDPSTLDTLGVLDYNDQLPHANCWESAHPHYNTSYKTTLNYLIDYGKQSDYIFYQIHEASTSRQIIAKIPVEEPSYMHSFSMTENFLILTEYPFVAKPIDFLIKGKPFIKNFTWKPERGTRFTVVDRKKGHVISQHTTEPFFAFHHVNAFEEKSTLNIDIVTYQDASIIDEVADYFRPKESVKQHKTSLKRFKLNIESCSLKTQILHEGYLEFPRINPLYDGKAYNFAYLIDARDPSTNLETRGIYKVKMSTKEWIFWEEAGCYPGEAIFVSLPHAKDEDDGLILAVVLNHRLNQSFLLILDGKTLLEIGRAYVPHAIPPGLHGQYFSTQFLI